MVLKAVSLVESSLKKVASPQILSLPQPWLALRRSHSLLAHGDKQGKCGPHTASHRWALEGVDR